MKQIIRNLVFETNSSASHSIVILPKEDYDRWEADNDYYTLKDKIWYWRSEKGLLPPEKGKIYTRKEIIEKFYDGNSDDPHEIIDEWLRDEGFITSDEWQDLELEMSEEKFITPSGDQMIALCAYGYEY